MDDHGTGFLVVVEVVRAVELAVCLAVAAMLATRWRRHRSAATAAAIGLFGALALVIASGYWEPDTGVGAGLVYGKAVVLVTLAVPYLLVLFTRALRGLGARTHGALAALYALEVVVTVAVPPLPSVEGVARPGWVQAYTAFAVTAWAVQSAAAAAGLWRAGRDQSSVVRHRMRSLSAGALVLAVALVAAGAAGPGQPEPVQLAVTFAGLAAILLFALAFLLPPSLRLVWRQADLAALADAERGLMTAMSARDVADTIVPVLGAVSGGGAAALLDRRGVPVRAQGADDAELAGLAALLAGRSAEGPVVQEVAPGVLVARLDDGWLAVRGGHLAPVFGDDEAVLLDRVATLVALALQRVALFEREKASRLAAEAANAELETLLYSVSHDLRSPLISVLGYVDFLRAEHGGQLTGDGDHYLERISVNALYMQNLIADLLELSRIGRTDPPAAVVDLQVVAEQVVDSAQVAFPAATVQVAGRLPRVRTSDVRARQLLTNLVDNALKHGGRDDLTVTVAGGRDDDGSLRLEVRDDGRGIPPEYRTRVLRVFERLDAPKSSPGTGMGLAICKRIAESLGGSLEVDGPPRGAASGAVVRATLPASVVVDVPPPRPSPPAPAPAVEEPA